MSNINFYNVTSHENFAHLYDLAEVQTASTGMSLLFTLLFIMIVFIASPVFMFIINFEHFVISLVFFIIMIMTIGALHSMRWDKSFIPCRFML